jgi:rhamnose transport system substrate-binding protein
MTTCHRYAAALGLALALLHAPARAADPVSIVYIPKNAGNPYFDSIVRGFEKGCQKPECDFTTAAPQTAEATSQLQILGAQVQRGVHVIAISPNSPDALNTLLDRARAKGTLVITVNSDMPGNEGHRDAAILPVDFSKTGPSQVELLGSQIEYRGEIAILSATTDAPDQNVWIAAMKQTLATKPYEKMKLVKVAYGNDDPQKSSTETEALLASYPNLRGIIAPTTVGVAAAAQVVETAGKSQQVKVVGLGTPNQMRRFIDNGTVQSFQLWSPYNQGVLAAYFARGVRSGEIKNVPGTVFNVPDLGSATIGKDNVIHTQPELTTFDRRNIGNFSF